MIEALILSAVGVIIGVPIVLYGLMRADEGAGRANWIVVVVGLVVLVAPIAAALVIHNESAGGGRYYGR